MGGSNLPCRGPEAPQCALASSVARRVLGCQDQDAVSATDSPQEALSRLFMLPGAEYSDPEFSWKFALAPAAIGFLKGRALGPQSRNDLLCDRGCQKVYRRLSSLRLVFGAS